nr:MAG: hypothetical protein 1 [Leviviridae sp.]
MEKNMGPEKRKRREFLSGAVSGQSRSSHFGTWTAYSDPGLLNWEDERTHSHAWLGSRWSEGGPWHLTRDVTTFLPEGVGVSSLNHKGTARIHSAKWSAYPMSRYGPYTDAELAAMGTTAIARTEPTNPTLDLSVTLGEMRAEGLPYLPGELVREKTRLAKAAGKDYLNIEFGWLPLISDLKKFAYIVQHHDELIRQYQEGAGKIHDRSYEWPIEEENYSENGSFQAFPASAGSFTGGGRHQYRWRRTWFEAEYIYYLPTGNTVNDKIRRFGSYARKLYGLDLNPEVLWNLAPWSWATDWFFNTGDIMHNISAFMTDGLVMRNAYIMCHEGKITTDQGKNPNGGSQIKTALSESKTRIAATPYGFGVSYEGLSLRQKAVIAALGLSRW